MKNLDIKFFRQQLKKRLKDLKMSREVLAGKAGISPDTIDKWFRGKKDDISGEIKQYLPSLDTIYKVSQVLGVSIDYFVNTDMNCLTVSNQQIYDLIGLDDDGISGMKNIKAYDDANIEDMQQALCVLPVLNDILKVRNGIALIDILQLFKDYFNTSYFVPVHYDSKGQVHASSKKYDYAVNPKALKGKKKVGSVSHSTDFYIQDFAREDDIHSTRQVAINKEFMQAVALKQLEDTLKNIKRDMEAAAPKK